MTELELANVIAELYKAAGWKQDRMSDDITLSKMSAMQHNDLAAMIEYFQSGDEGQQEPGYILANVGHDLTGLRAGFLGLPEDGFSPRSSGYATRVA